jgi:hypothetical protein
MSSLRRSLTGLESRKLHVQSLRVDVYPTTAKFRSHPRQSVKTGPSLTAMRRLFPEMSDECLVYICLRRPYRRSGLCRSVVGSCGSRVVRFCNHCPVLGRSRLRPMRSLHHDLSSSNSMALAACGHQPRLVWPSVGYVYSGLYGTGAEPVQRWREQEAASTSAATSQ